MNLINYFLRVSTIGIFILNIIFVMSVEAKSQSSYKSLKKACDGGEMKGCHSLGLLEAKKGNLVKAQSLYKKIL